jgi:hypothetical protein
MGSNLWYYAFPLVIVIIALLGYKKPGTGLFLMFILLFFSMFRGDHVGNDTYNYMDWGRIQYRGGNLDISLVGFIANIGNNIEFIDILINRLVYKLSLPPRLIIYIYSFITFLFFNAGMKRYSTNRSICLALYVLLCLYFFSLSAARQMAAVSVLFYAMSFLVTKSKGNSIRFFIWNLVAICIHASSLFFLPLLFLRYLRFPGRRFCIIIMLLFMLIFVVLSVNILPIIQDYLNIDYFLSTIDEYGGGFGRSPMGKIFDLLKYSFILFVFIQRSNFEQFRDFDTTILPRKRITNNRFVDIWDTLFLVSFCFAVICSPMPGLISRSSYFLLAYICAYVGKHYNFQKKANIILFLFWCIIMCYDIGGFGASALTSGYYMNFNF